MSDEWFVAHVIIKVCFLDHPSLEIPYWENMILLHAKAGDDKWRLAEQFARKWEDLTGTAKYGGRPATFEFAGVRKIVACEDEPANGVEMSYSCFVAKNGADFAAVLSDMTTVVTYVGSEDDK